PGSGWLRVGRELARDPGQTMARNVRSAGLAGGVVGILAAALSAGSAFEPDLLLLDQAPAPVRRIVDMPAPVSPATAEVMGRFKFTYYWVAEQGEAEGNVPIHDRKCKVLARVPRSVRDAMRLEGSGRLADGRVLNYWGKCRCS